MEHPPPAEHGLRRRFHEVIFESDTPLGKAFDVALIVAILLSVLVVMHVWATIHFWLGARSLREDLRAKDA